MQDCYFCLHFQCPTHHEAIAIPGDHSQTKDDTQTRYKQSHRDKLTLQSITEQDSAFEIRYAQPISPSVIPTIAGYMRPLENIWWAYASWLTPCIYDLVLHMTENFCVLVQLILGDLHLCGGYIQPASTFIQLSKKNGHFGCY